MLEPTGPHATVQDSEAPPEKIDLRVASPETEGTSPYRATWVQRGALWAMLAVVLLMLVSPAAVFVRFSPPQPPPNLTQESVAQFKALNDIVYPQFRETLNFLL